MEERHFITIIDPTKDELMYLLAMAEQFEMHPNRELLKGKVVATLSHEPPTRTRSSFEMAANRLRVRVVDFLDAKASSVSKGETPKDTILMVSDYADLVVMCHHIGGAAQYVGEVAPVPIINAGDGAYMYPSQCLLDLYSIYKIQGTLENLNIYLAGDLKHGRTMRPLIMAMRHLSPTFHFTTPNELSMPMEYKLHCQESGIKYQEHTAFNNRMLADIDILYMTCVQKERFFDLMEYEHVKNVYILRNDMLKNVEGNLKILYPLPRVNKTAYDVDDNPHAYYIQQAQNGLYAKQIIFSHCLGITLEGIKQDKTITE